MEKLLLTDLIEINRDINFDYRDSKQPKFIKNIIVKKRRNKLRKIVDTITNNNTISSELLSQYFLHLELTYPPNGLYKHCRNIEYINREKGIKSTTFCIDINEYKILATFTDNKDLFDITYSLYINGQMKTRFCDPDVEFIINKHIVDENEMPWRGRVEQECVRDTVCITILNDIKQ